MTIYTEFSTIFVEHQFLWNLLILVHQWNQMFYDRLFFLIVPLPKNLPIIYPWKWILWKYKWNSYILMKVKQALC